YKTSEVDWVLDRLGQELDLLRGQLSSVHAAAVVGAEAEAAEAAAHLEDDQEPT
ncbi:MAG: cell division protein DivIVA, partial [Mycobacterium sp.]